MAIKLVSPSFNEGGMIPAKHAYDRDNLSPALSWTGLPAGTKALALVCDDPDAPGGTWIHWVLYDMPAGAPGLAEGLPAGPVLTDGTKQGMNDFRKSGYGGPCPPGGTHRYFFRLYALDGPTNLKAGATVRELRAALKGHVLEEGDLMGRYSR